MGFLLREEKENLFTEYNLLREEIWDRDYKTWVVDSILIVGSLLAAFTTAVESFSTAILSLVLVASALILHWTSERVTTISYDRIEEIEKQLKITGPTRMFTSKIAGQWWYIARRNVAYALFTILIGIYLYLIFNNIYVSTISIVAGILLIVIKERSFIKEK
jgi:hypothetical protein